MSPTVNYKSHADKRARYPRQTIPLVIAASLDMGARDATMRVLSSWLVRNGLPVHADKAANWARLARLHEACRAGLYVDEPGPVDHVRPVEQTIHEGGDCEDWAAVMLAVLALWGVSAQICTAGEDEDNYQHIFIRAFVPGSRWYYLDPKGSQGGAAFDINSAAYMAVQRLWEWKYDTRADHLDLFEISPEAFA